MQTPIHRTLTAVLLVIAVAASACNSDDSPAVAPATTDTSTSTTATGGDDAEPASGAENELEDALATIVVETGVPALGAAVFDHDGLLDQGVAGLRQRDGLKAVTIDDVFHLGSNTKAMTAALLARIGEQNGPVGFDTTLAEAFGDVTSVHSDYSTVTLEQLLSHTGGAPNDDDLDIDESVLNLPVTEARALASQLIVSEAPAETPGTVSAYSNSGYVIVAGAIETATGQTWEELMISEIFTPLEMDSCGFGPPGTDGTVDQPLGHDPSTGQPVYFDNPAVIAPAGGVHCSMADWGRFLVEILNGLNGESSFLAQASVERLLEPAAAPVKGFDGGSALGWLVAEGPEGTAYFHNGSNTAWFSQATIVPAIDRVVISVTNEASTGEHAGNLAFAALAEFYPA
ncbi:MAG: beta-lactamase family protein [Actinomycetia bacterium]|nr:beta-lactamase family protein [Actinomycetes bacterium]MCP4963058.1 beta-lactamase family protein [Actinomycetes bacterium]